MEQQLSVNPVQAPQSPAMAPLPSVPGAEQQAPAPETAMPQEMLPPIPATAVPVQSTGTPVPPPVPQVVPQDTTTDDQADDTNPQDADDIDVIEKAWVDRAKAIVSKTKTDPYEQEKQVNVLQADYMKKRYGRDLGLVEN